MTDSNLNMNKEDPSLVCQTFNIPAKYRLIKNTVHSLYNAITSQNRVPDPVRQNDAAITISASILGIN